MRGKTVRDAAVGIVAPHLQSGPDKGGLQDIA
jgi:hypothetical protein